MRNLDFELASLELDSHGRAILFDDALQLIEDAIAIPTGGANTLSCSGSGNIQCANSGLCGNTTNSRCVNEISCSGASNSRCSGEVATIQE